MRQLTLTGALASEEVEVVDLFCGAGGFSCGAALSGHRIVLACDDDPEVLEVHRANHPQCVHLCATLPVEELPLPQHKYHIHGSPPCQGLSIARTRSRGLERSEAKSMGLELVDWFLGFAISSNATSWSMEQVAAPQVLRLIEKFRLKHPKRCNYAVFEFCDFGLPQKRRRVIAGSLDVIQRLMVAREESQPVSVAQSLSPCPAMYVWNKTNKSGIRHKLSKNKKFLEKVNVINYPLTGCFSIHGPSPTICAGVPMHWANVQNGRRILICTMKPHEMLILQGFPKDFKLPLKRRLCTKIIGNALPPIVAKYILPRVHAIHS